MAYANLEACLLDLERKGQLIRVKEKVDPYLEMAAIQLKVYEKKGPALLFENIAGTNYRAASNIFGTVERSEYIFRDSRPVLEKIMAAKKDPTVLWKKPFDTLAILSKIYTALPLKQSFQKSNFQRIQIADLPLIHHWKKDGGAFITLPQVYSEDIDKPGIQHSNLGMYRIQLTGNDYIPNQEIGLHYQLHRGIGVHHTKAQKRGAPLRISCFIGGPPANTLSAVMPLPEGMSELNFAGLLGNRRFRYYYEDGFLMSADADFVITGWVYPEETKPEGPFGDHLGYYSLTHPFPVMRVHKVYAKKNGVWAFTVVGRPPQEDTSFGDFIHKLTGDVLQKEIPGLKVLEAVDAAGVHPLLLAIGSERYAPFLNLQQPAELLTIANKILGTGQLSLAKYLWITADASNTLKTNPHPLFFKYILERIRWERDLHFYTNTTIDTLDYTGDGLNMGSKLVIAAYGQQQRVLGDAIPHFLTDHPMLTNIQVVMEGIICLELSPFKDYATTTKEIDNLCAYLKSFVEGLSVFPLLILADDAAFVAKNFNNFLWVCFTRSDPAKDIYGVNSCMQNKHWGCRSSLIIDARIKPHHAPILEPDAQVEKKISPLFEKGGSLYALR